MGRLRDISLVTFAILAFGSTWLWRVGIYLPDMGLILLAAFVCGILLVIGLIRGGRRKLWLLVGIVPAFYWPALFILGFAAFYLGLVAEPPVF